jgi:hypothetical protein
VFTARYGLIPYIKQISFRLLKVNVLWIQEENPDILFIYLKIPDKRILSRFPNEVPVERDTHLQGNFTSLLIYLYLSLRVPGKRIPSMFLIRVPMHRDTPSPEPKVYLFIHICLPKSPKRRPPTYEDKHKVTVHRAPRRPKVYK